MQVIGSVPCGCTLMRGLLPCHQAGDKCSNPSVAAGTGLLGSRRLSLPRFEKCHSRPPRSGAWGQMALCSAGSAGSGTFTPFYSSA